MPVNETVDSLLGHVRAGLAAADFDDPGQEARILVSGLLGLTATQMLSRGGDVVPSEQAEAIRAGLARRLKREPVHRILGAREFYGLMLALSPGTLEPRPDTETLVDAMLPHVRARVAETGGCRILDLGTGTGAICLALLSAVDGTTGIGADISADALRTAEANAALHGLSGRFHTVESDWFGAIGATYDAIVSNPPYIRSGIIAGLDPEVREHDPMAALDGGDDGLDAYRAIARDCDRFLAPAGLVGVEIGFDQKASVAAVFAEQGFRLVRASRDLGGNDRVLIFSPGRRGSFGTAKKTLGIPWEAG